MFSPGDTVMILSTGGSYSTYTHFFEAHGMGHLTEQYLKDYDALARYQICTVLLVAPHGTRPERTLCVLKREETGAIYLISSDCLELIKAAPPAVTQDEFDRLLEV